MVLLAAAGHLGARPRRRQRRDPRAGDRVAGRTDVIRRYQLLDELHPTPPLLPATPYLRARARAIAELAAVHHLGVVAGELAPYSQVLQAQAVSPRIRARGRGRTARGPLAATDLSHRVLNRAREVIADPPQAASQRRRAIKRALEFDGVPKDLIEARGQHAARE